MNFQNYPSIKLLGVDIHSLTMDELNKLIEQIVEQNEKHVIANVNIHAMNIAHKEDWFKSFLNKASINFCDGDGVRLGALLKGKRIVEKITYNRWIWKLAEISQRKAHSWYLLGSKESSLHKAVDVLNEKYPGLKIAGHHHGYLDANNTKEVVADIQEKSPDILILGMGMPIQEKFLDTHYSQLKFNVALTGGAIFDYISGDFKMTPDIYYRFKLEWFYRFMQQPKRLFRRYFIGIPLFFIRTLWYK